jgi:hypothetical protein
MKIPLPDITKPTLSNDSTVWFSAYGFGWGYCAFALPFTAVREQLGARDTSPRQLMLAFELGRRKIVQAVVNAEIPLTGDRVTLDLALVTGRSLSYA